MKGKKTGGRTKGTSNKARAEVQAVAQTYTTEALTILASIMRNKSPPAAARVTAVREILDRGYGKAPQALQHSGNVTLTHEEMVAQLEYDDQEQNGASNA